MGEHAKLSPSSAERWMHCPGSVREAARYPDTSSEYADEGTFAHEMASRILETGMYSAPSAFRGRTSKCKRFRFDGDMLEAVSIYVDACRRELVPSAVVLIETRVDITPDVWGTADFIAVSGDTLKIFDYKHGQGVAVSAHENPQLRIYALGALRKYPTLQRLQYVVMQIVQPRHHLWRMDESFEVLAVDTLQKWERDVLYPAINAARNPAAPLRAGDWCRWCPAKGECPELRDQALTAAREAFSPITAPPPPAALSPARVSEILTAAPLVREWLKAVHDHALSEARAGRAPAGWKAVETLGNRKWTDERHVADVVGLYVEPDASEVRKLKSPAQLEKMLPASARKVLEAMIVRPITGAALVPESDPRPAVNAASAFTLIENNKENES